MTDRGAGHSAIGARVARREDARFLRGDARFVADIVIPGMQDVAFLRSPVPSAFIDAVEVPEDIQSSVVTAAHLDGIGPIRADATIAGYRPAYQPVLAHDQVRYQGEPIAAAFAASRAKAEDVAERIGLKLRLRPPVLDIPKSRSAAELVHTSWPDNLHVESVIATRESNEDAPITVTRTIRSARQSVTPMECRGIVAQWNEAKGALTAWISTQAPHIFKMGIAETLGLSQSAFRVIAPDVGGGFGYKGVLLAEEVLVCWLALTRRGAFRWIQDRQENLVTGANCRDYLTTATFRADRAGKILSVEADAAADAGAYSAYPFTACLEGLQLGGLIAGPYEVASYRSRAVAVATNKPPFMPFRGTARPGACLVTELMIDALARKLNREPWQVRRDNLIPASKMPYVSLTGKQFDSGDYAALLDRLVRRLDIPKFRDEQLSKSRGEKRIGVGMAFYNQQAAYGAKVFRSLGIAGTPGYEQVRLVLLPDARVEIFTGVQSHGQGLETSLAQVAAASLGIAFENIAIRHGDTALSPFSTGTYGSRCGVIVSGAIMAACEELQKRCRCIAAHLLQVDAGKVELQTGRFSSSSASVSYTEIAKTWYERPYDLPPDVDPMGLEVVIGHRPEPEDGTFGFGAHGAKVTVDIETGAITIDDYAILTDAGRMLNPLIVEGQVIGGWAQGLGTALFEAAVFDEKNGCTTTSLRDYLLPSSADLPAPALEMSETLSPYTSHGQKGVGEAATIPVAAAIANAVNDALQKDGVEILEVPLFPSVVRRAIREARA